MAPQRPPLGSHLYSPRLGYDHHGIYVGLDKVIHHSGFAEPFVKGPISLTSLEAFSAGKGYQVKHYGSSYFSAPDIVTRARSVLASGGEKYHLLFNNCEHFATWCVTGVSSSDQVNDAARTAARVAATEAAHAALQKMAKDKLIKTAASSLSGAAMGAGAGAGTGVLVGTGTALAGLATAPVSLPLIAALGLAGGLLGLLLDD